MERRRAAEPTKVKGKKRKANSDRVDDEKAPVKKKVLSPVPITNPSLAAANRAVASSLAQEEAKRKSTMTDAIKSLYGPKDGKQKETFMTMGTFTRYA